MAAITNKEREYRKSLLSQGLKFCPKCKRVLSLSEFAENRENTDGRQSYCRACYASYYDVSREQRLEWQRSYGEAHREETYRRNHQYYQQNRETLLEKERQRYISDKSAKRRRMDAYLKTKRGQAIRQNAMRRRRSREKGTVAEFGGRQWIDALEYFDHRCAYCGESSAVLHQDHYIPVSKGGPFVASNVVPACPVCNLSKKDTLPEVWASGRGASRVRPGALEAIRVYFNRVG